ncbi:hypothetical protein KSK55_14265 [Methanospirillum purgamenti]|uniref:Uncharacterized protein n=1 Tax=Methanospirillum hungatei TaxID=2203 RepID=A0A8F5ZEJ3_METHU|nr:hypothetical protein [Methanospirillum hungatei]QXO94465.1 hypothetical protein KSK55_14265 [Methanospirillum hungatei]
MCRRMALLYHSIATVVMAHRQYAGRDQITRIPTLNTIMIGGYSGCYQPLSREAPLRGIRHEYL